MNAKTHNAKAYNARGASSAARYIVKPGLYTFELFDRKFAAIVSRGTDYAAMLILAETFNSNEGI